MTNRAPLNGVNRAAGEPDLAEVSPAGTSLPEPAPPVFRWYHKLWFVVLIIACAEMGVFLVWFPWTRYWDSNFFSSFLPGWRSIWSSAYCRGAVTGIGFLNLYVALGEIFRLRRFSQP